LLLFPPESAEFPPVAHLRSRWSAWFCALLIVVATQSTASADELKVGLFDVDASPPLGSWMAYNETTKVLIPLSARGIVLTGAGEPIVICSVDWLGIGNGGQTLFRQAMAEGANTSVERTAIHTLHQHDAIWCDTSVDELLEKHGVTHRPFDSHYARDVARRLKVAIANAVKNAQPVTHLGLGEGIVEKVASNRRVLGPDGKVLHVRWSAVTDPVVRDFPEGVIDPKLKAISLWNGDKPLVVMTFYATHPQSFYRTGEANPDFPGIARNMRQESTGVPHIHFNGAGGNITAGKYNDGSKENRPVLAKRVADGMERAWEATAKTAITSKDISWKSVAVALPVAAHLKEDELASTLADASKAPQERFGVARELVWLRRCQAGEKVGLACLSLGKSRVLTMPGELFIEYQLAAQKMRPDLFVAMAAYGEYGPAYIGTQIAYSQGGYETEPRSSHVAPEVEKVLMEGIGELLDADPKGIQPLQ
jgi:hypothetical protein